MHLARSAWIVALAAWLPAAAGSIAVRWAPLDDPRVAGYRVYFGTTIGVWGNPLELPSRETGSAVLDDLLDCTTYYLTVRSYDEQGRESPNSNLVAGWTAPRIRAIHAVDGEAAATIGAGQTRQFQLVGSSLHREATYHFDDPLLQVTAVEYLGCELVWITVEAHRTAPPGSYAFEVRNPDETTGASGRVPSPIKAVITVLAEGPVAGSGELEDPVQAVFPSHLDEQVRIDARPRVRFRWPVDPASIVAGSVELLKLTGVDEGGVREVPLLQETDWPRLTDPYTVELNPVQAPGLFDYESRCRVFVRGGAGGPLRKSDGAPLGRDWRQQGYFRVETDPGVEPPGTPSALRRLILSADVTTNPGTECPASYEPDPGLCSEEILWNEVSEAQYYEVFRCDRNPCWKHTVQVGNTQIKTEPGRYDWQGARIPYWHVGWDGNYVPPHVAPSSIPEEGRTFLYHVRACKLRYYQNVCGLPSVEIYYGPISYRCYDGSVEVPCAGSDEGS